MSPPFHWNYKECDLCEQCLKVPLRQSEAWYVNHFSMYRISVIHVLVNIVISCLAFKEIGGYDGMVRRYMSEDAMTNESYRLPNTTCHEPDPNAFRMLREADDDYMPWPGFLLGQTPGSIWYWCADQVSRERAGRISNK